MALVTSARDGFAARCSIDERRIRYHLRPRRQRVEIVGVRVAGAVDGDRHQLCGAVHGRDREGIGQCIADIERLHHAVVVVERVGPHAGHRHRKAAVATRAHRRRRDRREGVGRIVDVGVGKRAGRGRRARRGTSLDHRAGRGAGNDGRVVAAGDGDRHQLGGAVYGGHREGIGQCAADIERLHGAIGIVERVGPHAGRRHRKAAVAARARRRRADCREGVGGIVDVGIGKRAGCGRRARRGASLDH